jgi:hypothetical protein
MTDTTTFAPAREAAGAKTASWCLITAAVLFGAAWWFMPVAGVTDPLEIFRIVTPQRGEVLAASILPLVAATLYVAAMIALIRDASAPFASTLWRPAAVVVVGAPLAASTDLIESRTVGLIALWLVAAAQLWLGVVLWRR